MSAWGGGGRGVLNSMTLPGGFASDFSAYRKNSEQRLLTYSSEVHLSGDGDFTRREVLLCLR